MEFDFEKYDQIERDARFKRLEHLTTSLVILSEAVIYQETLLEKEANDLLDKIQAMNNRLY
jgi:hypothetical protein